MCSHFLKRMDQNNIYQGDLADIFRPSATTLDGGAAAWQFSTDTIAFPSDPVEDFGDPFAYTGDPLTHNMDSTPLSGFFRNSNIIKDANRGFSSDNISHDQMKRPSNIFSRMLQISPIDSPPPPPPPPPPVNNNCNFMESPGQISSPRNTGIKRRKSQAKKVVCIPAPAPANSRATGEVVPSDLWAWRKYGQKPIKGSPYPRGYYRCSSSKGCSARKQVERSRTDPNMLVITYTWEHNHPWPTQRNALAGSTRSQPSKSTISSKISPRKDPIIQEEKEQNKVTTSVKEENIDRQDFDNQLEMENNIAEFDEGFSSGTTYKPALMADDNFFADLGEIEADPLDLLFTQGFCGGDHGERENKDFDPFSFYG